MNRLYELFMCYVFKLERNKYVTHHFQGENRFQQCYYCYSVQLWNKNHEGHQNKKSP